MDKEQSEDEEVVHFVSVMFGVCVRVCVQRHLMELTSAQNQNQIYSPSPNVRKDLFFHSSLCSQVCACLPVLEVLGGTLESEL